MYKKLTHSGTECNNYLYFSFDAEYFDTKEITEKLNGLRHKTEKGKICWYIWSGEYSENDDFFKPICAEHLLKRNPKIIKYLGLDDGFRFLITESGYEDVWFDKKLLET